VFPRIPSATDHRIEIAFRAYDALRDLARREPQKVRSLFRNFPQVLSDLGLESPRGRGRPKRAFRVLSKTDRKDLLIWRADALGMTDGEVIRDLGRRINSASRRYIKTAIARVNADTNFDRLKAQIVEQYQTRQQIGAALRSFRRQ